MTSPTVLSEEELASLRKLAHAATGGGKQSGEWYTVEQPWLPSGCETYIVAGSPDPHAGLYVCDFVDASQAGVEGEWTDEEWSSRNWAIAEYVAAAGPNTVLALLDRIEALEKSQLSPGTVEVCHRYVFHDCVNNRGHLQWKYGRKACTYGSCPVRAQESAEIDGAPKVG